MWLQWYVTITNKTTWLTRDPSEDHLVSGQSAHVGAQAVTYAPGVGARRQSGQSSNGEGQVSSHRSHVTGRLVVVLLGRIPVHGDNVVILLKKVLREDLEKFLLDITSRVAFNFNTNAIITHPLRILIKTF